MAVLYRKYRPQTFSEIIGQEHVTTTLINQLKSDSLAHAYLFTGPKGVGKTSVARILARSVNCFAPKEYEPDNECLVCREITSGASLDFNEIDAASHTGVDNIRDIIEHLRIPPSKSRFRIFIIDEVHMLSRGAFNAILKTLEEPPDHVLFILATTEAHKIPATVISRTQRFDFKRLTPDQIKKYTQLICEKQGLDIHSDVVAAIAQSADGSARDAMVLLEKAVHLTSGGPADIDTVQRLLGITPVRLRQQLIDILREGDLKTAMKFFNDLVSQGYHLEQFNKDFLEHLRLAIAESGDKFLVRAANNFVDAHGQLRISPVAELPLVVAAVKTMVKENKTEEIGGPPSIDSKHKTETVKTGNGHIEMTQVAGRWNDILDRVRQYNQSLLSALKLAKPVGAVNGSITIAFPYKFHAETVNAAKNRLVIERVVEEIFGHKIAIKCVAKADMASLGPSVADKDRSDKGNGNLVDSALEILGGELVE